MKIKLLVVGKTDSGALDELISHYSKRVNRFASFEIEIIPDIKHSKKCLRESRS